jgi:hypothetical protein
MVTPNPIFDTLSQTSRTKGRYLFPQFTTCAPITHDLHSPYLHTRQSTHTVAYIMKETIGILTYLLTPWSRALLEKLAILQLVKKFPAFYGTRKFLTALTSARQLSQKTFLWHETSSRGTPPPPGDPSGGVVYLRIVLSPEEASRQYECFITGFFFFLRRGVVSTSPNSQPGGPGHPF